MIDINCELDKIIKKYNLDMYYPAYQTSRAAKEYVRILVKKMADAGNSGLFICSRWEVAEMINRWAINTEISAICISEIFDLQNYMVKLQKVEKIYVASYHRTNEILHWLWRNEMEAESIYDILGRHGIHMQMELCDFFAPIILSEELDLDFYLHNKLIEGSSLTLYEYYYQKKRYEHCICEEDKKCFIEKMFFLAICMRNFVEAKKLLQIMPKENRYCEAWKEIELLLGQIKDELQNIKQKDIVIYWLDAIGDENADKLDYLKKQEEHSVIFSNAYTTTGNTRPVMNAMFCQILQIDDCGYKEKYVGTNNSNVLKHIEDKGYRFSVISSYLDRYFDMKYHSDSVSITEKISPCSEILCEMVNQMLKSEEPIVFLSHILVEFHSPRLSVKRCCFEKEYAGKAEVAEVQLVEMNEQLQFYDSLLGRSPYRIYMSDHGVGNVYDKTRVHFQVYHEDWSRKEINKLFCYLDFHKIMDALLEGQEIEEQLWERDFVPVQDVDCYDLIAVRSLLPHVGLDILPYNIAYRGIATSEYLYLRFRTGDELLHRWADGKYVPVIGMNNEQKDSPMFSELREKAGTFPKVLETDPQFSFAKNMYILYDNLKKTVQNAADLLDERLTKYEDKSIALLEGGYHSLQLYSVLSKNSKKKIGVIIDKSRKCLCRTIDCPLFEPDDKLPKNIKTVILSSFENLEELRLQADEKYYGLEVIDIYKYWKECGYDFSRDFWYGLKEDRFQVFQARLGERQQTVSVFSELQRIVTGTNGESISKNKSQLFCDLKQEAEYFKEKLHICMELNEYADKIYEKVRFMLPQIAAILNEKLSSYSDESVMLRPGGYHTLQLYALLDENSRKKIGGIIDGFPQCRCKDLGYKIYSTGEALPKNAKAVMLSTYLNLEELTKDTKNLYQGFEMIDIYQIWKEHGYRFWKDFWYGTEDDWNVS